MVILSRGDCILPAEVFIERGAGPKSEQDELFGHLTFQSFKDDAERRFLVRKLAENDGNISKTARALEMQRNNLYKKIEKYGLDTRTLSD